MTPSRRTRRLRSLAPRLGLGLLLSLGAVAAPAGSLAAAAATPAPPTIMPAVDAGPPGLAVPLTGDHFNAGTTYGLCLQPSGATANCGYAGSDLGSFTADAGGNVPAGARFEVPNVLAGTFQVLATAPGTAEVVAAAPFSVTSPSLALDSNAGPAGLVVTVSGTGYGPGAAYILCIAATGAPQCGGAGIDLGRVTADASGALPAGTTVTIPGQLPASYTIGIRLDAGGIPYLIATVPFVEVSPTMLLNPAGGPGGTLATITGAGLAPGAKYVVCIVAPAQSQCGGAGTNLGAFTADAGGAVPAGTTVVIPLGDPGDYPVGILLADSQPFLIGSVTFSRTAGTAPPVSSTGPSAPGDSSPALSPAAASPSPSAAPASSEQGGGGPIVWILLALGIVAIIVIGLVLARRRQSWER